MPHKYHLYLIVKYFYFEINPFKIKSKNIKNELKHSSSANKRVFSLKFEKFEPINILQNTLPRIPKGGVNGYRIIVPAVKKNNFKFYLCLTEHW